MRATPIWISLMINFTSILLGFFLAINFSTIIGQTGDWAILCSGFITAFVESANNIIYTSKKKLLFTILS